MYLCDLKISINTIINPRTYFGRCDKYFLAIFHYQTHTTGTRKRALQELFLPAPVSVVQSPTDSQLQEKLLLQRKQGRNHFPLTIWLLSSPLFFTDDQTVVSKLPIADSTASGSKNWVLCPTFNDLSTPSLIYVSLGYNWVPQAKLSNTCESPSHAHKWWPDLLKKTPYTDTEGWPSTPSTDKSKGISLPHGQFPWRAWRGKYLPI